MVNSHCWHKRPVYLVIIALTIRTVSDELTANLHTPLSYCQTTTTLPLPLLLILQQQQQQQQQQLLLLLLLILIHVQLLLPTPLALRHAIAERPRGRSHDSQRYWISTRTVSQN